MIGFRCGFYIAVLCFLSMFLARQSVAGTYARIGVVVVAPYVTEGSDGYQGIMISWLNKILKSSHVEYKIKKMPNDFRGLVDLKIDALDFFLPGITDGKHAEDVIFVGSPIETKWCWLVEKGDYTSFDEINDFRQKDVKIGTLFNTMEQEWLEDNRFYVSIEAKSPRALPLLLLKYHRVNAVFLNEVVFNEYAAKDGIDENQYKCVFGEYRRMGFFVSKKFALMHADLIKEIENSANKDIESFDLGMSSWQE